MPIKGVYKKPKVPEAPTLTGGIESLLQTVTDLHNTKSEIINAVDTKIQEVDNKVEVLDSKIQEAEHNIKQFEESAIQLINDIHNIPQIQGVPGADGNDGADADEEKIIEEVLKKIPAPKEVDIKAISSEVLKQIPESKPSLKIIQEAIDPQTIIDKIANLEDKKLLKIKADDISGLEKVIETGVSRSKQYLHGGGDTVVAGTNISITSNPNGTKTINSTGGGTPGGSTTQLQYNNAGAFGGISGATTDGTSVTYTTGNLKAADVKASGSGGLQILSNNGTVIGLFGAGGGANSTFYGGLKADYATASTIAIFDASKNLISADTTTYPSLTELSYVKGVTSSIQTQLNAKTSGTGAAGQATFWTGTSSTSGDNDFWWDNTNKRLGLGTNSPAYRLDVNGDINLATATTTVGSIRSNGGKILNVRGTSNLFVGGSTGNDTYTGTENVGVGNQVLQQLGAGTRNTGLGVYVLQALTSGSNNTGVGYGALGVTTGSTNTALGYYAGRYNTTGSNQIFINGLDRSNYTGDQTGSPIYIQQSTTLTSQYVTLNGRIGIGTITPTALLDIKSAGVGEALMDAWPSNTNYFSISLNGSLTTYNLLGSSLDNTLRINRPTSGAIYFNENNNPQMVILTGGNVGIGTAAPSSKLDITTVSLGTSQTTSSGLALINTTAAAAGAQQISPALRFTGQGWKTNATAASQATEFRQYLIPVQGTANPTSKIVWESSVAGGSWTERMSLTDAGKLTIGENLVTGASSTISSTSGDLTLLSFASTKITANGTASIFAVNNTGLTTLSGQSITGSGAGYLMEFSQTWNTTGVPTLIRGVLTNTASGAGSKMLDLIVGSTSIFNVGVNGNVGVSVASTSTTALLHLAASTTSKAPLRIAAGTAPTSPNDGDIWTTSAHIYARLGGVSYQLDQQATYTFSTGLTLSGLTVTNNLSTGVSGGQDLKGSTTTGGYLNIYASSDQTGAINLLSTYVAMQENQKLIMDASEDGFSYIVSDWAGTYGSSMNMFYGSALNHHFGSGEDPVNTMSFVGINIDPAYPLDVQSYLSPNVARFGQKDTNTMLVVITDEGLSAGYAAPTGSIGSDGANLWTKWGGGDNDWGQVGVEINGVYRSPNTGQSTFWLANDNSDPLKVFDSTLSYFISLDSGGNYGTGKVGVFNNNGNFLVLSDTTTGEFSLAQDAIQIDASQNSTFAGTVRLKGYTVATLPTGVVGDTCYVTDALAPTFGATVVGSGAVTIPVFYNGSNWIVG